MRHSELYPRFYPTAATACISCFKQRGISLHYFNSKNAHSGSQGLLVECLCCMLIQWMHVQYSYQNQLPESCTQTVRANFFKISQGWNFPIQHHPRLAFYLAHCYPFPRKKGGLWGSLPFVSVGIWDSYLSLANSLNSSGSARERVVETSLIASRHSAIPIASLSLIMRFPSPSTACSNFFPQKKECSGTRSQKKVGRCGVAL